MESRLRLGERAPAPVRIVWNADSTFEASRAEVSILLSQNVSGKEHLVGSKAPGNAQAEAVLLTEQFCLFSRHGPEVPQIALVADEHDDDLGVGVVAQFLEPSEDVDVGRVLGDVVHEQGTDSAAVVAVRAFRASVGNSSIWAEGGDARRSDCSVSLLSG